MDEKNKQLLDQILKYAAERKIQIPADIVLKLSTIYAEDLYSELDQGQAPSETEGKILMGTLRKLVEQIVLEEIPTFTLLQAGLVPPPGKKGLMLLSDGWKPYLIPGGYGGGGGGGTGISDAPGDSQSYVRYNRTWIVMPPGVTQHSLLTGLDYASAGHTGFQASLTFPLTPDLGGTGIANLAASTLTLGAATSITGGGTLALGGFTGTVPATATFAMGAGTLTNSTTNNAGIAAHTHAITGSTGLVGAGTAQNQILITESDMALPPYRASWSSFYIQGTTGGTITLSVSNTKNLQLIATDDRNITFPITGTAAIGAGTLTAATTNDVTVNAHTHAVTGFLTAEADPLSLHLDGGNKLAVDVLHTNSYDLTVPATGTAALLATANVFTAMQTISIAGGGNAIPLELLSPDGGIAFMFIGKALSNNNIGYMRYVHMGDGFANNYLAWGFYGADNLVTLDTTGLLSATKIGVASTATVGTNIIFNMLASGLNAGASIYMAFGKALGANYNTSFISYHHVGDGSSSNYLTFDFWGVNNTFNIVGTARVGINTYSPGAVLEIDDTLTSAGINPLLNLTALGSGANNDGGSILLNGKSSTTAATAMGLDQWLWVDATHASRKARRVFNVYDTAIREGLRIEASGTAPMIGFLGAAAVAQQANTVALDTLLVNYGLRASGGVANFATEVQAPTSQLGGATNYINVAAGGIVTLEGTAGITLPHLMQSDNTDQAISSAVEEQVITFDTDDHHKDITRTSSSRFTITKAGSYLVTFSAVALSGVAAKQLVIWMKKNGANVASSATYYTFKAANANTIITVTFLYHFAVNDYFEFWMYGNDTGIKLDYTAAVADNPGVTPAIPACPSIIMTANYVSYD